MTDNLDADPREERLPVWAQTLIRGLRATAAQERAAADVAREDALNARRATDPDGSTAILCPYDDVPVGLGFDARVRFRPIDKPRAWVDVRVHPITGRVEVSSGGPNLAVYPAAANVLTIEAGRW